MKLLRLRQATLRAHRGRYRATTADFEISAVFSQDEDAWDALGDPEDTSRPRWLYRPVANGPAIPVRTHGASFDDRATQFWVLKMLPADSGESLQESSLREIYLGDPPEEDREAAYVEQLGEGAGQAVWQVFGDALQVNGDPAGEVIALSLLSRTPDVETRLRELLPTVPFCPWPPTARPPRGWANVLSPGGLPFTAAVAGDSY